MAYQVLMESQRFNREPCSRKGVIDYGLDRLDVVAGRLARLGGFWQPVTRWPWRLSLSATVSLSRRQVTTNLPHSVAVQLQFIGCVTCG